MAKEYKCKKQKVERLNKNVHITTDTFVMQTVALEYLHYKLTLHWEVSTTITTSIYYLAKLFQTPIAQLQETSLDRTSVHSPPKPTLHRVHYHTMPNVPQLQKLVLFKHLFHNICYIFHNHNS
jgi:hypothetical protein